MKKHQILPLILIAATVITATFVRAQQDDIILNNKETFIKKQRPSVKFPHGLHMGSLDCMQCHHNYDEKGNNILDASELEEGNEALKCSTCHELKKSGGMYGLMDAFHLQCMGCHRKMIKKGEKTGPQICGQCHPWK